MTSDGVAVSFVGRKGKDPLAVLHRATVSNSGDVAKNRALWKVEYGEINFVKTLEKDG